MFGIVADMASPGWYADPAGRFPHRYWDGTRWTDYVASPAGQSVDPLLPAQPVQQVQQVQPAQPAQPAQAPQPAQTAEPTQAPQPAESSGSRPQQIRTDPGELQAVLAELGIQPMPPTDGSPFTEPMLILAFSAERPDALEWWTPAGVLVAVATIIEKQKPGSLDAPDTDQASGLMIGARLEIAGADGTPIARTVRTLKPAKPPTFVDDPQGRRLLSVAQEKVFSKIPSHLITSPDGAPLGKFVGTDMRGRAMNLTDPSGTQLATVVKYGKWDGANVALEFSRNRPLQTPTEWLASRAVSALWPIKRERICNVLIRQAPPSGPFPALLTFMAPLLLEHTLSLL